MPPAERDGRVDVKVSDDDAARSDLDGTAPPPRDVIQEVARDLEPDSSTCPNGKCEAGEDCKSCPQDCKCPAGKTCCSGICADLNTDTSNCGACNRKCVYGGKVDQCYSGGCCFEGCRNGSEICDDQRIKVPSTNTAMFLVCKAINIKSGGGVAYVSQNTSPYLSGKPGDNVYRCQGWEQQSPPLNAWDHLKYIAKMTCTSAGQVLKVDLAAWKGKNLYVGVHRKPPGKGVGHMTEVCIAAGP